MNTERTYKVSMLTTDGWKQVGTVLGPQSRLSLIVPPSEGSSKLSLAEPSVFSKYSQRDVGIAKIQGSQSSGQASLVTFPSAHPLISPEERRVRCASRSSNTLDIWVAVARLIAVAALLWSVWWMGGVK